MSLTLLHVFLLTLAAALLVPGVRWRALALLGAIATGLAGVAFVHRLGAGPVGELAARVAERGAPLTFLQINGGLLLLGTVLVLLGALLALVASGWRSPSGVLASGFALIAAAGGSAGLLALAPYIGWGPLAGWAIGLAVAALILGILARAARAGEPFRRLDRHLLETRPPHPILVPSSLGEVIWLGGLLVSGVVALAAPTLRATTLAIAVAAVASHVLLRRSRSGSPIPVPVLLALFLVPVVTYFTAIAGNPNPALHDLAQAPFSPAAEVRIFPWVALAAFGLAGLWPLHGLVLPLVAPLAGVVLIRLGTGPLPDGAEHWAPLAMPVLVIGAWHAAATINPQVITRRTAALLVAGGLAGGLAGADGITGAWYLLATALVLPWLVLSAEFLRRIPLRLGMLAWLVPGYAGWLVAQAGLNRQVTYTVLLVAAVAVAVWRGSGLGLAPERE